MAEQPDLARESGRDPDAEPSGPPPEVGPDDLLMLLLSVPERVMDLTGGLDEGRLRYRHGPAFPTAAEVIAHSAVSGLQVDAFVTAVSLETGEPPPLRAILEAATPADVPPLPELLADWQRVRRRGVDLLRGLAPERWEAPLVDPDRGALTVIEACSLLLRHELGHVAQLRNLIALVPEVTAVPGRDGDHA